MRAYRKWQLWIGILGIILLLFSVVRFAQVVALVDTTTVQRYIHVPDMGCLGVVVDIVEKPNSRYPLVGQVERIDIFTVLPPGDSRCASG